MLEDYGFYIAIGALVLTVLVVGGFSLATRGRAPSSAPRFHGLMLFVAAALAIPAAILIPVVAIQLRAQIDEKAGEVAAVQKQAATDIAEETRQKVEAIEETGVWRNVAKRAGGDLENAQTVFRKQLAAKGSELDTKEEQLVALGNKVKELQQQRETWRPTFESVVVDCLDPQPSASSCSPQTTCDPCSAPPPPPCYQPAPVATRLQSCQRPVPVQRVQYVAAGSFGASPAWSPAPVYSRYRVAAPAVVSTGSWGYPRRTYTYYVQPNGYSAPTVISPRPLLSGARTAPRQPYYAGSGAAVGTAAITTSWRASTVASPVLIRP